MEKVREKYGDKLADTPLKIVLAITNDPNINVEQLATQLQLSTSAVEKQLAKLKKEGLLIRHGTKGGFWEILKS